MKDKVLIFKFVFSKRIFLAVVPIFFYVLINLALVHQNPYQFLFSTYSFYFILLPLFFLQLESGLSLFENYYVIYRYQDKTKLFKDLISFYCLLSLSFTIFINILYVFSALLMKNISDLFLYSTYGIISQFIGLCFYSFIFSIFYFRAKKLISYLLLVILTTIDFASFQMGLPTDIVISKMILSDMLISKIVFSLLYLIVLSLFSLFIVKISIIKLEFLGEIKDA